MSQFESVPMRNSPGTVGVVDEGLRAYMLSVYNYMAGGILLTGIVAYLTYSAAVDRSTETGGIALTGFGQLLYGSPLKWIVMLAPLASVLFLSVRVSRMSVGAAQLCVWLFSSRMGLSLPYTLSL